MIKLYEEYNQLPEIPKNIKDRVDLNKFISNGDGTFTYDGDLYLNKLGLTELPNLRITQVNGSFTCHNNELTSLKYCPSVVKGTFWSYSNKLTSLKYCPSIINGNFWCNDNQLISFKYSPSVVNGNFWCHDNLLLSIKHNSKIGKGFSLNNPFDSKVKQPFTEITEEHKEVISKMSKEELSDHLVFLGKYDQRAYKLLSDYLKEIGYDTLTDEDNPFGVF